MAVRATRREGPRAHGHIADSVSVSNAMPHHLRRSEAIWRCRQERTVKPSAQPTLVRTQHLPPPAEMAPWLRKRGPAGRFLLVAPCIRVCHRGSMHSSGYGQIADSVRAERAVRITARFADLRPFCSLSGCQGCTSYWCAGHPAGSVRCSAHAGRWAGLARAYGQGGLPDRTGSSH